MKALSIEEIKQLKKDDWVWVELKCKFVLKIKDMEYTYKCSNKSLYFQIEDIDMINKLILITPYEDYSLILPYDDYGKTWVAYKNKEQADCKGELVELPCNVGDKVYYLNIHPSISLKTNTIYEGKVVRFHILNSFNSLDMDVFLDIKIHNEYGTTEISNTKDFGVLVFKTKEQAEQKLKELRGKQ